MDNQTAVTLLTNLLEFIGNVDLTFDAEADQIVMVEDGLSTHRFNSVGELSVYLGSKSIDRQYARYNY